MEKHAPEYTPRLRWLLVYFVLGFVASVSGQSLDSLGRVLATEKLTDAEKIALWLMGWDAIDSIPFV